MADLFISAALFFRSDRVNVLLLREWGRERERERKRIMSCHKLVRCQNFGKRRTSENQAGQGVDLDPERTKLDEQKWRGVGLAYSLPTA